MSLFDGPNRRWEFQSDGKELTWVPELYDQLIRGFDKAVDLPLEVVVCLITLENPFDLDAKYQLSSTHRMWTEAIVEVGAKVKEHCSAEVVAEIFSSIKLKLESSSAELVKAKVVRQTERLIQAQTFPSDLQSADYASFIDSLLTIFLSEHRHYLPCKLFLCGRFGADNGASHSYVDIAVVSDASLNNAADEDQLMRGLRLNPNSFVRPSLMTFETFREYQRLESTKVLFSSKGSPLFRLSSLTLDCIKEACELRIMGHR
jgi:hypothetical protein